MRRKIIIPIIAISCFLSLAVFDITGGYHIAFQTHDLGNDLLSVDSGQVLGNGAGYIEIVWNTGDTGSTIIIDTPGIYIVSVKDIWNINHADAYGGVVYYTNQQKCLFLHGNPDGVKIDTIVMDTVIAGFNQQVLRTFNIIDNNGIVTSTIFRDTAWTDATKSYYTETHGTYTGFWSGKLDTIIIAEQRLPIMVNAKAIIKDNSILSGKRWRVMQ